MTVLEQQRFFAAAEVQAPEAAEPPSGLSDPVIRRWTWTGDDLIRMGELGILPPEERFELLNGEVYVVPPPGPPHSSCVDRIGRLLDRLCDQETAHARQGKPIRLSGYLDPQPDVAVVRGPAGTYDERFPAPEDVLLVVEVSDSSLEQDRTIKLAAYAEAAIPEYWVVNRPDRSLEVYRDPVDGEYRTHLLFRSGDEVTPLLLPDAAVAVTALLGKSAES
jgi:Uma2 family endonuclease